MGTLGSGLADSCWFNIPALVLVSSITGTSLLFAESP